MPSRSANIESDLVAAFEHIEDYRCVHRFVVNRCMLSRRVAVSARSASLAVSRIAPIRLFTSTHSVIMAAVQRIRVASVDDLKDGSMKEVSLHVFRKETGSSMAESVAYPP